MHNRGMAFEPAIIKILIIETEPGLESLIRSAMEPVSVNLVSETSINPSIRQLSHFSPDIIILDLNDLGKSNCEACSEIRKVTKVPILVLSPFDSPRIVASTLNAGADDYLTKPIQILELRARIDSLLKRFQVKPVTVTVD